MERRELLSLSGTAVVGGSLAPHIVERAWAQNAAPEDGQVRGLRIYEDARGNSHLETLVIPDGRFRGREDLPATRVYVREYQGNTVIDWLPSPAPQFVIPIFGEGAEVEVSGGVRHRLRAGEFIFEEDTKGKGHITRTPAGRHVTLFVRVPDSFDILAWVRGQA